MTYLETLTTEQRDKYFKDARYYDPRSKWELRMERLKKENKNAK